MIGRRLSPLMMGAGLDPVAVSPRAVYADAGRPGRVASFTLGTFTAMVAGVPTAAVAAGLADGDDFDAGLRGFRRTAEADGTFCYTCFDGVGVKPRAR